MQNVAKYEQVFYFEDVHSDDRKVCTWESSAAATVTRRCAAGAPVWLHEMHPSGESMYPVGAAKFATDLPTVRSFDVHGTPYFIARVMHDCREFLTRYKQCYFETRNMPLGYHVSIFDGISTTRCEKILLHDLIIANVDSPDRPPAEITCRHLEILTCIASETTWEQLGSVISHLKTLRIGDMVERVEGTSSFQEATVPEAFYASLHRTARLTKLSVLGHVSPLRLIEASSHISTLNVLKACNRRLRLASNDMALINDALARRRRPLGELCMEGRNLDAAAVAELLHGLMKHDMVASLNIYQCPMDDCVVDAMCALARHNRVFARLKYFIGRVSRANLLRLADAQCLSTCTLRFEPLDHDAIRYDPREFCMCLESTLAVWEWRNPSAFLTGDEDGDRWMHERVLHTNGSSSIIHCLAEGDVEAALGCISRTTERVAVGNATFDEARLGLLVSALPNLQRLALINCKMPVLV